MSKLVTSLLVLSLGLSANAVVAQTKPTVKVKTTKTVADTAKKAKTVAKKAVKKTVVKTAVAQSNPVAAPVKETVVKKKVIRHKKHIPHGATHEQETIEVESNNNNTVIEINKGEVYVNGDRISTIENPRTEKHKIVVRHKEEELVERRKPIESSETKEDHNRRPMLGVYSDHNSDYHGAYVSSVVRNSPAADAGLLPGDVITRINGRAIASADELVSTINDHNGGETVNITYERQGREYHAEAELSEMTTFRRHETYRYKVPDLHGNRRFPTPYMHSYMFNSHESTYEYAPHMGIEAQDEQNGKGVIVVDVRKNSPADFAGLQEGDLILRLDHQRTTSVDDIQDILNDTWPNQRISIEFKRNGVLMFAYMRFTKDRIKKDL